MKLDDDCKMTRFKRCLDRRTLRGLMLFTVATLAAGCAAFQPKVESVTLYVFAAEPVHRAGLSRRDAVIEVALPRATPGADTPQIAYVRKTYEIDYFANSRWADTPARMLAPLLVRALEQTESFRAVIQIPSTVPVDFRLDTEIVQLRHDFGVVPSRVEMMLRAQLTDVRSRSVIASRIFEEVESARTEDAAGGVAAANVALQRMLAKIAEFCVGAIGP